MNTLKLFLVFIFFVPLVLSGQVTALNEWYVVDSKNCVPSSRIVNTGMVGNAQSFKINVTNPKDTAFAIWEKRINKIQTPFAFDWWWNLYESIPSQYYVRYQFYIGSDTTWHQLGYPYQSDMRVGRTWWYGAAGTNDPIPGAPSTMNRIRIRVYTLSGAKTEILEWRFDELLYYYRDGKYIWLDSFEDSTVVGIDDKPNIPTGLKLFQNYPNPFNPVTTIKYTVAETQNFASQRVTIKVYDLLGREITTIVNGEKSAGIYTVQFDGKNIPNGVYICLMQTGEFKQYSKMVLLK